jgi:hypothetical protein
MLNVDYGIKAIRKCVISVEGIEGVEMWQDVDETVDWKVFQISCF